MGSLDHALFLFCNKTLSAPWLDPFMVVLTHPQFLTALFSSLMVLYLVRAKRKRAALLFILFALITYAIADAVPHRILKPLFGRLRPCNPSYFVQGVHQFLEGGRFLVGLKTSYSMPSIHAVTALSQALFWGTLYPKVRLVLIVLASVIAYTRLYVGVHYPSDVLVGGLLGALLGYGMAIAARGQTGRLQPMSDEK